MQQVTGPMPISVKTKTGSGYLYIPLVCFSLFSTMLSISPASFILRTVSGGLFGLFYVKITLLFTQWVAGNKQDNHAVKLYQGFIYFIPFIMMAFVSRYLFGWGNIQAFVAPAIMGAAAGMNTTSSDKGGKIKALVIPIAASALLFILWNVLCMLLDTLERGLL